VRILARVLIIATLFQGGVLFAPLTTQAQSAPCEQTFYPLADNLGSVNTLTDAAGAIVLSQHFLPFGESFEDPRPEVPLCGDSDPAAPADEPWPYGFTGQYHDQETGLVYFHARYYNPVIGHFMSPDSVIPNPSDTYSYDRYAYCRNNPVNLTDPTGHFAPLILLAFVAIGAAVGAIVAAANGGNVWQGALAGAISGAMTFACNPEGWTSLIVSQSVNLALHATQPGRMLIQKVGDAIGSQILGDVLVTAMATGAIMKSVSPKTLDGHQMTYGELDKKVKEIRAKLAAETDPVKKATLQAEFDKWNGLLVQASGKIDAQIASVNVQRAAKVDWSDIKDIYHNSGYGRFVGKAIARNQITKEQTLLFFKDEAGTLQLKAIGISASVRVAGVSVGPLAQHTAVSWWDKAVNPTHYPNWTWGTLGPVCHQTTADALHQLVGVPVNPAQIFGNWSGMLSTGLYGNYGSWGGVLWPTAVAYEYQESMGWR
jgi:RHS repeat-associated protein